jgi:hypothetical protein
MIEIIRFALAYLIPLAIIAVFVVGIFRNNENLANEALLSALSQVASPETIANSWNCSEESVRQAQRKFGISSERYKNNVGTSTKKA